MKVSQKGLLASVVFGLILCVSGCATQQSTKVSAPNQTNQNEPQISKSIYFFQHKLIAQWLYESDGAFFSDLKNGDVTRFMEVASEVINPEYANNIVVTDLAEHDAVLITFPDPYDFPNCYFVLMKKQGATFSYYTYEKTMDLGEQNIGGVLGGWTAEGSHLNYGPRSYRTAPDFVKDVLTM
jgi:hypothetical protein